MQHVSKPADEIATGLSQGNGHSPRIRELEARSVLCLRRDVLVRVLLTDLG